MYTLSSGSHNASDHCVAHFMFMLFYAYLYNVYMMHLNVERVGEKNPFEFKMFCGCSVGLQCMCFSLPYLSSEANLLSLDDSDGPFSPSEEKKVNNLFISW